MAGQSRTPMKTRKSYAYLCLTVSYVIFEFKVCGQKQNDTFDLPQVSFLRREKGVADPPNPAEGGG